MTADFVNVTITDLEQLEPPASLQATAPANAVAILRAKAPPVHFYRYLYDSVGRDYNWISRRSMSDEALADIICDPGVFIYVLYVEGAPAGFCEIDLRDARLADIKFFGLIDEFIGRGLGRYFFNNVVNLAWAQKPEKIKLETCSLDHPAALRMYQKTGFRVVNRRHGRVEMLRPESLVERSTFSFQGIPSNER